MKRFPSFSGRLALHSKIASSAREMSPLKAWALGVGSFAGVALLAFNTGMLDSSRDNTVSQAVGLSDSEGSLAHAYYSAGMTQDLGTFAGLGGAGAVVPHASAENGFSSSSRPGATFLYSGGGVQAIDALHGAYNLSRDISSARHAVGNSNAAFGALHPAFRASGGSGGGGYGRAGSQGPAGGGAGQDLGRSAAKGGEGVLAGSADSGDALALAASGTGEDLSASVRGDDDGSAAASAFAADGELQALPFSQEAALAGGVGAGVAEGLLATGISEAGESLATIQAAVLDAQNARVPDLANTWALIAVAFAGLTFLRRLPA